MKKKLFDWVDGLSMVSNQGQPPILVVKEKETLREKKSPKEELDKREKNENPKF